MLFLDKWAAKFKFFLEVHCDANIFQNLRRLAFSIVSESSYLSTPVSVFWNNTKLFYCETVKYG
jgi:hypothetical protein